MADQNRKFYKDVDSSFVSVLSIFSGLFRRHTKEESARILVAGTAITTPDEETMLAKWVKPYMFLRIFLVGMMVFAVGYVMGLYGGYTQFDPVTFLVGSFLVPMVIMFFYWEMNIPRNISFASVLIIFLVGGVYSLVVTLFLYTFYETDDTFLFCFIIGIVEELGKVIVICFWLRGKDKKYILTGMLVGAAVGAGFAAVETSWYTIVLYDWDYDVLFTRAALAIGSHVSWAALNGGALVWAKGDDHLKPWHLLSPKFLGPFLLTVVMHAAWDLTTVNWMRDRIVLSVGIVVLCLLMLWWGLRQVVETSLRLNGESYTRALLDSRHASGEPISRTELAERREFWGLTAAMNSEAEKDGEPPASGEKSGEAAYESAGETLPYIEPERQAETDEHPVRVRGLSGVYENRSFSLKERISMGRDYGNDLVFPPETPGVSSSHCELFMREDTPYIRDLSSTYGTYVNGLRIEPETEMKLSSGNIISVGPGNELFRVEIG